MKDINEFDFEKHYGDEKQTPPPFFWDDLEKQLPKKRRKPIVIFWVGGIAAVAALVFVAVYGTKNYSQSNTATSSANKEQAAENISHNTNKQQEKNTAHIHTQTTTSVTIDSNPKAALQQSKQAQNTKQETGGQPLRFYTKKQENNESFSEEDLQEKLTVTPAENIETDSSTSKESITNTNNVLNKETPEKEETLALTQNQDTDTEEAVDTTATTATDSTAKSKRQLNFIVSAFGLAHTHSFKNYNGGYGIGVAYAHKINKTLEVQAGLNFMQINNPGLQRSSYREHYFVTKTTTLQELDINKLNYLATSLKVYYTYKKYRFFAGGDIMFLVSSKANLRTTEVSYSEKRVTEKEDLVGYTNGVKSTVGQLAIGAGRNITNNIGIELQLSHSITTYGSKSLFLTSNKLKLSYISIGVNWRIKN